MKKLTLTVLGVVLSMSMVVAQSQRLCLIEHFTQASCGPCASQNPTLEATLNANSTKAVAIKHQVSWPGTDPMNAHYPAGPGDRRSYYGITGVPNTVLGGIQGPGAPNTVVTTATINSRYAVASPFDLNVSFTKAGGVINATADINCSQAVSGNLVLHIVVVEKHIAFGSAPGSNGETDFYNVCKQYLPNTSGTSLSASWAVNDNQTVSESWTWTNVYDDTELAVVAFIQDNTTKEIHQAAWAPTETAALNDDAGISDVPNAGNICSPSWTPQVTLLNYGANNLTSATINYDLDGGTTQTQAWTGSLAPGASTTVTLSAMSPSSGYHTFNAWTTNPNSTTDANTNNDDNAAGLSVGDQTIDLQLITDCWGSETSWEVRDASNNVWAAGGNYPDVTGGATYNESFCLVTGDCYDFVLNDAYGDGMHGSQWGSCTVDGNYTISDQTPTTLATMIAANSDFGNQEINNFCVPAAVMPVSTFSGNPTSVCAGSSVAFSDASTGNITTWNWTFPGGVPGTSTQQNPTVTYANAGNYDVTLQVSDGTNSDTQTLNSYIQVNANPTGTTSVVDASCGQSNGSVTVTAATGQAPYAYSWSPSGGTGATASGLAAGVYTVTITDANGCVGTALGTVANPGAPSVTGSGVDATCAQNDGSASVTVTGGQQPYTYVWSPNVSTGSTASGLAAGTYSVTVTDGTGCASSTTITITAPPLPVATSNSTDEICDGDCDGTLDASASGGTSPFTYSWDNGVGSGATHTGVCPGSYEVTVTDANGCTTTSTTTIAAGSALPVADFTPSATTVNTGIAVNFTNNSTGGTSYSWDFGDGNNSTDQNPSHSYTSAGTYTVVLTVTNAAGCTSTFSEDIIVEDVIDNVEEAWLSDKVSLYPNPTQGITFLQWDDVDVDRVEVVNALGQVVFELNNVQNQKNCAIDLSESANGLYYVNVYVDGTRIAKRVTISK